MKFVLFAVCSLGMEISAHIHRRRERARRGERLTMWRREGSGRSRARDHRKEAGHGHRPQPGGGQPGGGSKGLILPVKWEVVLLSWRAGLRRSGKLGTWCVLTPEKTDDSIPFPTNPSRTPLFFSLISPFFQRKIQPLLERAVQEPPPPQTRRRIPTHQTPSGGIPAPLLRLLLPLCPAQTRRGQSTGEPALPHSVLS